MLCFPCTSHSACPGTWAWMTIAVAFSSCIDIYAIEMDMRKELDTNHELQTGTHSLTHMLSALHLHSYSIHFDHLVNTLLLSITLSSSCPCTFSDTAPSWSLCSLMSPSMRSDVAPNGSISTSFSISLGSNSHCSRYSRAPILTLNALTFPMNLYVHCLLWQWAYPTSSQA